jgi:hypothetical protein
MGAIIKEGPGSRRLGPDKSAPVRENQILSCVHEQKMHRVKLRG